MTEEQLVADRPKSATMHSLELPETMEATVVPLQPGTPEATVTPAVRVPTRLLSAAAAVPAPPTPAAKPRQIIAAPVPLPTGGRPRLRVLRGQKLHVEYELKDGTNFIGRRDDRPIDIDVQDQEPADRIWTSRRHALLSVRDGVVEIEDLNSLNGTFVNRCRVSPGQRKALQINDVIQIGTIQMRLLA